ncbi:inorganic phosphate transporter [Actinomycetota bacterium]|nr:inorganic phosphate transporter [Actinomycetota bacterium]
MELGLAIAVIVVALGFDFTNGFHDAANAIATSVSTRALKPRQAMAMAAVMNVVGALLGTAVAKTIAADMVDLTDLGSIQQLDIVLAALVGAIMWNIITWWFGLPSSSTHAIVGGLVGAGTSAMLLAQDTHVKWEKILDKVLEPMVLSPLVGFTLAYIVMIGFEWWLRNKNPDMIFKRFRFAQIFSSAALAMGHGLQDAQKSMGLIFMACGATGLLGVQHGDENIPIEIILMCAITIGAGTFTGGKRIMKTLGSKVIDINPPRAFAAEIVSASVLYVTAFFAKAPISTTHTVTSSILGSGATKSIRSVRWSVAKSIVTAWVLTLPAAATLGFVAHQIVVHLL